MGIFCHRTYSCSGWLYRHSVLVHTASISFYRLQSSSTDAEESWRDEMVGCLYVSVAGEDGEQECKVLEERVRWKEGEAHADNQESEDLQNAGFAGCVAYLQVHQTFWIANMDC